MYTFGLDTLLWYTYDLLNPFIEIEGCGFVGKTELLVNSKLICLFYKVILLFSRF